MINMRLKRQNIDDILSAAEIAAAVNVGQVAGTSLKVVNLDGVYPFHCHDVDEIFVILDGELTMDLDGMCSQPLKSNVVFCVPAGLKHRTRTTTPSKVFLIGPE